MHYHSWGRYPQFSQTAIRLGWCALPLPLTEEEQITYLPFGNGHSYGDCCLNQGGVLLDTHGLDRFSAFDSHKGILRCESGVRLSDILALTVPRGWFLPVLPGTKHVTVGGAIANDIHGKNHHRTGTFGCHVRKFELLRSDGQRLICSPTENARWFQATIGGLGLTGVILWAEIKLKPIVNSAIELETVRFPGFEAFFELSAESDRSFEYTIAWIDCMTRGKQQGRGLFIRGNHAGVDCREKLKAPRHRFSVPVDLPFSLINRLSVRVLNSLRYRKQFRERNNTNVHYEPFFFPLDGVGHWNRLYGPRGFFQYQCVVPQEGAKSTIREILDVAAGERINSSFGVIKVFGDRASPGLISFPRPGVTLALDFHNNGQKTLRLLERFDQIVSSAGGAVNPSKDARMSADSFKQYFPNWEILEEFRDAKFSSSFWRRVTGTGD
jgi:FAD/FMN-containing dehydrogenase